MGKGKGKGNNMLAVHPDLARRTLERIDEQCSLYYIIIGSVYNLAQSAMVDAVGLLKGSKWWRHEVKRDANAALAAYDAWNQKMRLKLSDRYQLWLDLSDNVADRIGPDVQKLRWSYEALLMKHRVEPYAMMAAMLTASTMNDIASLTFDKFLRDGSRATGVDMTAIFARESSFKAVEANWARACAPVMRCHGGDIDCNKDANCRLAADIVSRKLARFDMYEEACGYGAELNGDVVERYMQGEA